MDFETVVKGRGCAEVAPPVVHGVCEIFGVSVGQGDAPRLCRCSPTDLTPDLPLRAVHDPELDSPLRRLVGRIRTRCPGH